jgi:effector-binding domain-containing protein
MISRLPVDGDARVLASVLPAGRYATLRYTGHPDELIGVTASLGEWARLEGLTWDLMKTPDEERWAALSHIS